MPEMQVNRQYKDRLFKLIFRKKEDLLQLYNALNDTNYDNPEDIEVNTLEDVVYMGMKNDISFLMTDILNLYEHQSTFSPNLPLRGLFYYKENAALDCRAVVLNINLGYNKDVMEKCKKLKEYALFVARVRSYLDDGYDIETAVDKATDECIAEGILEQILRDNRGEVRSMLLTEYDEQAHIEYEKELSFEEGLKEGTYRGVVAVINICKSLGVNKIDAGKKIMTEFALEEAEANTYIEKYWE